MDKNGQTWTSMDKDGQKKRDFDLMQELWHLLKEYGDLTNNGTDESCARWSEYMNKSSALRRKYPEAKALFIDLEFMLHDRAVASNQGDLKLAC